MSALAGVGFFTPKKIPAAKLIPVALGFVGYVVLNNISLQINSVGFYQVPQAWAMAGSTRSRSPARAFKGQTTH